MMSLRLFGGWSLERIAKHEEKSLAHIQQLWQEARQWLVTSDIDGGESAGRIVMLDMVDPSLFKLLQHNPSLLRTLDWRAFEKLLAEVLYRLGYEVELQRGTKDGGVDIFAIRRDGAFGGHRYILQAKRWTGRVGIEPVRELLYLRHAYQATKACLATTSTFTAGAWKLAAENQWHLDLRDFDRL
jgi:restriction system protein